jgi:DNA-binding LacI/PurR family transcriptional regulator
VRSGIMDVAAAAGVSHITVSRVINNRAGVRAETRERVLSAMTQLDYRPNHAARALVTGRSRTIGVICYNTALYGPAAALLGLEQAAREAGYFVTILGIKTLDAGSVEEAVGLLRQQAVSGLIIISPQAVMSDAFDRLPLDLPTIAVWGHRRSRIPVVAAGDEAGAATATRHLLELGHRNVWHVAGPAGRVGAEDRLKGWRAALRAAGISAPAVLRGDWSAESGYAAGQVLAADPAVTSVFVANDQMALGVLRAFNEAGRAVPRSVSVVGFDDIPEAAYYTPPLTTIRQDFNALGRKSVALLLRAIGEGNGNDAAHVTLPVELVVRESTAPPRGR